VRRPASAADPRRRPRRLDCSLMKVRWQDAGSRRRSGTRSGVACMSAKGRRRRSIRPVPGCRAIGWTKGSPGSRQGAVPSGARIVIPAEQAAMAGSIAQRFRAGGAFELAGMVVGQQAWFTTKTRRPRSGKTMALRAKRHRLPDPWSSCLRGERFLRGIDPPVPIRGGSGMPATACTAGSGHRCRPAEGLPGTGGQSGV